MSKSSQLYYEYYREFEEIEFAELIYNLEQQYDKDTK